LISKLHLFIIWNKYFDKKEQILNDLEKNFIIREVYEITWNEKEFVNNLKRFYGTKLLDASRKAKMAGNGSFLLILISDPNPKLERRRLDEINEVEINVNVYNSKMKYREWVGVDYALHASNSEEETKHDLVLLFGCKVEDYEKELPDKWDYSIKKIENHKLAGQNGWSNMKEFFNVLNETTNYVILRNFEDLSNNILHKDIDMLTDDVKTMSLIINLENPEIDLPIIIDNEKISIDFRYQMGHHYDEKWAKDVLKRRVIYKGDFYVPSKEDYFYTLFYHNMVDNSKKYNKTLNQLALEIGIKENLTEIINDDNKSKNFLKKYLTKMGYKETNITSRTLYKIRHNEFVRLVRVSIFLIKTHGIKFFLKKMKLKIKLMKNYV
jgi:hypothetical protein